MGIIYFDICAIPLFLILLFICYSRKMTKGRANQLFILLVLLSLYSTIADLGIEVTSNMVPLSRAGLIICNVSSYIYLALRNGTNVVLLLFLFALTRTTFLIRKRWAQFLFFLPYTGILMLLAQNPFTQLAFSVTAEHGYTRGPLILGFYGIATIYGLGGLAYCIFCRRYLSADKWSSLLAIYILVHLSVVIQFFYPEMLVEMFCSAIGEMLIMLSVMHPEERMDSEVGMLSWASYQSDLRNIILSGEHVQIIVIQIPNCREIRNYLGDHEYNIYLSEIAGGICAINWRHPHNIEVYHERPGIIYLITDPDESRLENIREAMITETGSLTKRYADMGFRFEPRVCLIRCPEDMGNKEDIIRLGHKFLMIDNQKLTVNAKDIVNSQNFNIGIRIEEILDRAIKNQYIEMYYQPIYDVQTGKFRYAEALARIIDPEYGFISPGIFIPAAETEGLIIPIGDTVLEQVFRFISEHDMDALGLSRIDVNLSVAQCMETSLPEKIKTLQHQYGVDPSRINLEITETTFENINDIVVENVNKLISMGYSFALDDYGIGYSNIQRVNNIPLDMIKIDKSMLDEVNTTNGRMIMEHTVRMMQSIGKQIVAEGAETVDDINLLKNMKCDYIQGFYYSRPLPSSDFIHYMEEQNRAMMAN